MSANNLQLRKIYKTRLLFRSIVLAFTILMYFTYPQSFEVMNGSIFFRRFSWLHILWIIWIADMIMQFIPAGGYFALGSLKQFKKFYKPYNNLTKVIDLKAVFRKNLFDAVKVLLVWIFFAAGIGLFYAAEFFAARELLLIAVVFYVLDLVFVLYWCPFRVWFLKNRCCTTCRIFNWDHLMMFSPLVFIPGFFTYSLFGLSVVVFLVWETTFMIYPERFCEETNEALRCSRCTEILCGNALRVKRISITDEFLEM